MDPIIQFLQAQEQTPVHYLNLAASLVLPFLVALIPATSYKRHHNPQSFNPEFYPTLILFAIITSYITLIIGGNVTRAFGLLGTLSIIRFRTPLKDPLDTIYIFWALALGMSCGTGFYLSSILVSVFVYGVMATIRSQRLYEAKDLGQLIRLRSEEAHSVSVRQAIEGLFKDAGIKFSLLNRKLLQLDTAVAVDQVFEFYPGQQGISPDLRSKIKTLPNTLDLEIIESKKDIFL